MPCITLLSDFGLQDASVAIAKGVLMQHTQLPIIDISHEVKPFHTAQAAYLLAISYKNFPAGTYHLLLFDLFSGATPRLLLCEYEGQYFLTPDNGLLPMALGAIPEAWLCLEMKKEDSFTDWLSTAGSIINKLQTAKPTSLGLPTYKLEPAPQLSAPVVESGSISCEVIHIDRYENVVLNMTKQQFEALRKGRNFRLQFLHIDEITVISNHYNDVRPGNKLCRFNSNGYLEICINHGNAASLFGLRLGSNRNNIKIFFE